MGAALNCVLCVLCGEAENPGCWMSSAMMVRIPVSSIDHWHKLALRDVTPPRISMRTATRCLQAVGGLLIALGLVHIAATPHMPDLLRGSPLEVYERAVGPTLLNHVLAGILLIPLGLSTCLAAAASERGEAWALTVLIANTTAVFTLPVSLVVFMRRPEYYAAPLFLSGVVLSCLISLLMGVATVALVRRRRRSRPSASCGSAARDT